MMKPRESSSVAVPPPARCPARRLGAASLLSALLLLGACGGGGDDPLADREGPAGAAPTANLALTSAATGVVLTSNNRWNLSKTGALSGNTVSWTVEVSRAPTIAGRLAIQGQMTVANSGSGAATIGNIVVNLQRRQGNQWVTASSNVADATHGDDATHAHIQAAASSENLATFTENGASGALNLMDASNNTVFSLVPQVTIAAGSSKTLLFAAVFDNDDAALQLAPGTAIRAEVIVSFGNATPKGNSVADVDINGNGAIDADEARVRSVASRLTLTVPAAIDTSGSIALADTLDDITATGDVQFSNVIFNLGATGGTVTANVTGGTNGGSITNCARLRSADQNVAVGGYSFPVAAGVDLQACSTVEVAAAPPNCTPGAPGCGWRTGEMLTATQAAWGTSASTEGAQLQANFNMLYPNDLVVGGTNSLTLTLAGSVFTLLPTTGTPASLTGDVIDPQTTSAGELAGEIVALQLNVDFSSIFGNAADFGSLRICNVTSQPALNDQTVEQFLATANHLLGGGSATIGTSTAAALARLLNASFVGGNPSTFAQENLVAGPCPANWSVGQMRTATQTQWGDGATSTGGILQTNFNAVYPADLTVGGTNSLTLTLPGAVFALLPTLGTAGSLTGDVVDPQTTSAGELAGEVVALQINVDFSAIFGNAVDFRSLRICGLASQPALNGQTVDQFLATANHLLGGGSAMIGASTAAALARLLNAAFADGTPSSFAQANLVAASSCN
jgi:hypothetical protein